MNARHLNTTGCTAAVAIALAFVSPVSAAAQEYPSQTQQPPADDDAQAASPDVGLQDDPATVEDDRGPGTDIFSADIETSLPGKQCSGNIAPRFYALVAGDASYIVGLAIPRPRCRRLSFTTAQA